MFARVVPGGAPRVDVELNFGDLRDSLNVEKLLEEAAEGGGVDAWPLIVEDKRFPPL